MIIEKIEIVRNTDLYNRIGTIFLIILLIAGLVFIFDYNNIIIGISIISSGIFLKIIFLIAYSICYRLDLLIDKK